MNMKNTQALMTVGQVAEKFNVAGATVRSWARSGKLPSVRVTGTIRFNPEAIDALTTPTMEAARP